MISGIDYLNKKPVAIEIAGGRIKRISDGTNTEQLILPGLFDLQINGFAGVDFNGPDLTCEDLEKAVIALAKTGITGFMPTIITNSPKAIKDRLAFLRRFQEESKWGSFICGFHLEGPFISPQDGPRGAHPKEHVRKPDWALFQEFQEAAGSGIRIVTVSPEWEGAADFIAKCAASGVKVAIGHTAANTHEIQAAAEAGASLSTHLGNGAHPVLPRHPNYIWDQLAEDRLWLTLIADGFHLPPAVIKVFLEVKKEKAILVSDAVSFAGCKPGVYESLIGGRSSSQRREAPDGVGSKAPCRICCSAPGHCGVYGKDRSVHFRASLGDGKPPTVPLLGRRVFRHRGRSASRSRPREVLRREIPCSNSDQKRRSDRSLERPTSGVFPLKVRIRCQ